MSGRSRLALLIGVQSCNDDLFDPLGQVVEADVARMADALRASGYDVRTS
jgi:hypothetical protein